MLHHGLVRGDELGWKGGGVGEEGFKELKRNDFLSVEFHLINAGHADIAEYFKVFEIAVAEAHPEARAFQAGGVFAERFESAGIY